MQRFWLTLSAAIMALTMAIAATPISAFAAEDELTQDEIVDIADDFIEVGEDGLFELPSEVANEIGQEAYTALMAGIEEVNKLIADGTLEVTANGTVYEVDDDALVVQGGNVDDHEWFWWGLRAWKPTAKANELANYYAHLANGGWAIATIAGLLTGETGGTSLAVCLVGGFVGWKAGNLSADISYVNSSTNRGVVIDITWAITYSVYPQ